MAFDELDDILGDHDMSASVGWAIKLRTRLMSKDEVREMRALLLGFFKGRSTQNWAFLLICAKQVRILVYSVLSLQAL